MVKALISLWKSITAGGTIDIVATSITEASGIFIMTSNDSVSYHSLLSNGPFLFLYNSPSATFASVLLFGRVIQFFKPFCINAKKLQKYTVLFVYQTSLKLHARVASAFHLQHLHLLV